MNESANKAQEPVLRAEHLVKTYQQGEARIEVLRDVSLHIYAGERVALMGKSGSGKSTLLHLLAGLDDVDAGDVCILGHSIQRASSAERARLRSAHLGFVFQLHHLLPEFDAQENVAMPLLLKGQSRDGAMSAAAEMLRAIGMGHRLSHRPAALSGGERQRVAVARAIVTRPALILADEPTGSLDEDNAARTFALLCDLTAEFNLAMLVATHDPDLLAQVDATLRLEDGRLNR